MRRVPSYVALLASGCVEPGVATPLPVPSWDQFVTDVAPVLEARCGTVACHGDGERPFALYAPRQRRLDPAARYDKTPLTEDELRANYDATLGFLDHDAALEATLVMRPLGGLGHTVVFEAPSDSECKILRAFAESDL